MVYSRVIQQKLEIQYVRGNRLTTYGSDNYLVKAKIWYSWNENKNTLRKTDEQVH